MLDEALTAQLNAGYVCPPDAGPAWRAVHEDGIDMSLIQDALQMTPEERLRDHEAVGNSFLDVEAAGYVHDAR